MPKYVSPSSMGTGGSSPQPVTQFGFISEADFAAWTAGTTVGADGIVLAQFDDVPLTDGVGEVLDGYAGLDWDAFYAEDPAIALAGFEDTGYHNGVVSPLNAVYNGAARDATVSSAGNFDFDSVWLTGAWRDGLKITVSGYDDGELKYKETVTVDHDEATLFNFDFDDIDQLVFSSKGGTNAGLGGDGTHFVADDFQFDISPGTITGKLFNDLDGDGSRDAGEGWLKDRVVILDDNGNGVVDEGETTATTNNKGVYVFEEVSAGEHTVTQILPDWWRQTSPDGDDNPTTADPATVSVDSGGTTTANFGSVDVSETTGGISGTIWQDADGNHEIGGKEVGLDGFTVFIDSDNDGRLDAGEMSTTTDEDGGYEFIGVDTGEQTVRVIAPVSWEHWEQTTPGEVPTSAGKAAPVSAAAKGPAPSIDLSADRVEGQVIVKMKDLAGISSAAVSELNALKSELGVDTLKETQKLGIELWSVNDTAPNAIAKLMATGLFEYVEPNYVLHATDMGITEASPTPNDPGNEDLYAIDTIDLPEAWNITTGSSSVVVGSIDTGVDYNHPDLVNNIWTNEGEIAGNGIDDDNNGYVDDIHGYDFVNDDGDAMDDHGHGTHTSGTIGAEGNNGIGVTGVAQDVSIMALKFLGADGRGDTMDAILAVEYATAMGADLTNNSWGGGGFSQALYDAIAAGPLFVAAAGNDGVSSLHYPAGYDLDNIISVAATDDNDELADFSNFGNWVDLAAPGVDILSTLPGGYGYASGTSMAAPQVAGVAALLLAANPDLTAQEIVDAILSGVDVIPGLDGDVTTGGRLNAFGALQALLPPSAGIVVDVEAGEITEGVDFGFEGGATKKADTIEGTGAGETIDGLKGNDTIYGMGGNDTLIGNKGKDFLDGGAGDDTLEGGVDADKFSFSGVVGKDTVKDFNSGEGDKIVLSLDGIFNFDDLTLKTKKGDTIITWEGSGSSSIKLVGVSSDSLDEDDFLFVSASDDSSTALKSSGAASSLSASAVFASAITGPMVDTDPSANSDFTGLHHNDFMFW